MNNINPDNNFQHTMYFVRTESLHFDPVIPTHPCPPADKIIMKESFPVDTVYDIEDEEQSDSDLSIVVVEPKDVSTDFNIDSIDNNDRKDADMKMIIVDDNVLAEENEQDEFLKKFDYNNPRGEDIFHCIFLEPSRYERTTPPKQVKNNLLYTIKDCTLADITSDDNRAYHKTNTNVKKYYVSTDENACEAYILHEDESGHYYKTRKSRSYVNTYVPKEKIYLLHRYYRFNKALPGLKQMVIQVESFSSGEMNPYFCVVYSLDESKVVIDVDDIKLSQHGNCKQPTISSKPYIRTNPKVLKRIDTVLETCDSASDVFYQVLEESGGPMHSSSPSNEPRSTEQVRNRKRAAKRRLMSSYPSSSISQPLGDLDRLILEQRNPESPVQTVLVTRDNYVAFVYTKKQLKDIELFCCNPDDNDSCVLAVDTTFKLCNMWLTDTSYRNKRLLSTRYREHPVNLGPLMLHFTKDEETFRSFCLEMVSANPAILDLKKIGVDMEAAIFNGFQSVLRSLLLLYCVRHLQKRDEIAIEKCQEKNKTAEKNKASYKQQLLWDIYGKRSNETFQEGLADSEDVDDFVAKLASLKPRWDKLCGGFFSWFVANRKKEFEQSVIKSARVGTNVRGLYYQNDVESEHAVQKRLQCYKKGSVIDAINTVKTLIKREEQQEVLAIYGGDKHVLAPSYKNWFASKWHSWGDDQKEKYLQDFRSAKPSVESTFLKPANPGQKPGYKQRIRITTPPTAVVDRHASRSMPSFVSPTLGTVTTTSSIEFTVLPSASTPVTVRTSSASSTSVVTVMTSSVSSTPSTTTSSSSQFTTSIDENVSPSLSFPDPRIRRKKTLELFVRADLPSTVVVCRGNCGEAITRETKMLVKTRGQTRWYDKKAKEYKVGFGGFYIHFDDDCLKRFDEDEYYAPNEHFNYKKITVNEKTKEKLNDDDLTFLRSLGVPV